MTSIAESTKSAYNYCESITEFRPEAKELLIDYAGVPESEVLPHVHKMRDKAWDTCPYGCVGLFAFTWPSIQRTEIYSQILNRVKSGQRLLDLGCGFGQNIRKLVYDGAPAENLGGADISQKLVDCGYEYFRDQGKLKSEFIIGDVLDSESPAFIKAKGSFDIVFASMFYHLWGWDDHIKACIETTKLLKPAPGSMIFGWQLGASPAGQVERKLSSKRLHQHKNMYQHDEESWKRMWKEIEAETGTKWEVHTKSVVTPELQARQGVMPIRDGTTLVALFFSMTRL